MGKKIFKFFKKHILGVLTGIVLAVIVWYLTGYSLPLMLLIFVAGYFVIGILVEFVVMFFKDANVKPVKRQVKVRPDRKTAIRIVSGGDVDYMTDDDSIEAFEEFDDDEAGSEEKDDRRKED